MRALRDLVARWRERRHAWRAVPGIVVELQGRIAELEAGRAIAAGEIIRHRAALVGHRRELQAIGLTLERTPTLRGRLAHNRRAVVETDRAGAAARQAPPDGPATSDPGATAPEAPAPPKEVTALRG